MRILAFGGAKGYTERLNLGGWRVDHGALGDETGVPAHGLSIGCGVTDGAAYLIVRQLQKDSNKRSTVFTLFLDPGEELWRRFHWNAAALALALFGSDLDGPIAWLLDEPESARVEVIKAHLTMTGLEVIPEHASEFLDLWWTAAVSNGDLMAGSEQSALGSAPDLRVLASRVAALPPAWRIGRGWIVGGVLAQHSALALALSVTFGSNLQPGEAALANGRQWQRIWGTVANSPLVQHLELQPSFLWDDGSRANYLRTLRWFGEMRLGELDADQVLAEIGNAEMSDLMRAELRHELCGYLTQGDDPLSPQATAFLINEAFRGRVMLARPTAERLDADTVVEMHVEQQQHPTSGIALPESLRQSIWIGLVARHHEPRLAHRFLHAALADLQISQVDAVLQEALRRSAHNGSLAEWARFLPPHPELAANAQNLIRDLVSHQISQRRKNWRLAYLAHCSDDRGAILLAIQPRLTRNELAELVGFACGEIGSGPLGESARKWLESLADSDVRDRIPWSAKVEMAYAVPVPWANFLRILRLLEAQSIEGDDKPLGNDHPERDRLLKEVEQGLGETALASSSEFREQEVQPDIIGLARMLGTFPRSLFKAFAIVPDSDGEASQGFLPDFPRDVSSEAVLKKAKAIFGSATSGKLTLRSAFDEFDHQSFVQWGREMLIGANVTDVDSSIIAKNVSKLACDVPKLREWMTEALAACDWGIDFRRLARRIRPGTPGFEFVVPCLPWPAQARVFHEMRDNQPLRKQAERICRAFLQQQAESDGLPAFDRALLHFLHSELGTTFRDNLLDEIGKELGLNAKQVERALSQQLLVRFGEAAKSPKVNALLPRLSWKLRLGGRKTR